MPTPGSPARLEDVNFKDFDPKKVLVPPDILDLLKHIDLSKLYSLLSGGVELLIGGDPAYSGGDVGSPAEWGVVLHDSSETFVARPYVDASPKESSVVHQVKYRVVAPFYVAAGGGTVPVPTTFYQGSALLAPTKQEGKHTTGAPVQISMNLSGVDEAPLAVSIALVEANGFETILPSMQAFYFYKKAPQKPTRTPPPPTPKNPRVISNSKVVGYAPTPGHPKEPSGTCCIETVYFAVDDPPPGTIGGGGSFKTHVGYGGGNTNNWVNSGFGTAHDPFDMLTGMKPLPDRPAEHVKHTLVPVTRPASTSLENYYQATTAVNPTLFYLEPGVGTEYGSIGGWGQMYPETD